MAIESVRINTLLTSIPEYIQKVLCDTNERTKPFKCAVNVCNNAFLAYEDRSKYPYKFHRFPLEKRLRKLWKRKCGFQNHEHISKAMVCSDHFALDDYIRNYREEFLNPNFRRQLKPEAYPKMMLGPKETFLKEDEISDEEYITDLEAEPQQLSLHPRTSQANTIENIEIEDESDEPLTPSDNYDIKREVDLYDELTAKEAQLQKEVKVLRSQNSAWIAKLKRLQNQGQKNHNKDNLELRVVKRIFSDAQINLLLGKKCTWTNADLARAFTMRHMGTRKAYLYMKNVMKIPLPSLSCLQKWACSYK